jgi:hypothetical protein
MSAKAHGTRTPETATSAVCNSFSVRGAASADADGRILLARVSSYYGRGWYTVETADRGVNGAPLAPAGSGEAWVRANREALGPSE